MKSILVTNNKRRDKRDCKEEMVSAKVDVSDVSLLRLGK